MSKLDVSLDALISREKAASRTKTGKEENSNRKGERKRKRKGKGKERERRRWWWGGEGDRQKGGGKGWRRRGDREEDSNNDNSHRSTVSKVDHKAKGKANGEVKEARTGETGEDAIVVKARMKMLVMDRVQAEVRMSGGAEIKALVVVVAVVVEVAVAVAVVAAMATAMIRAHIMANFKAVEEEEEEEEVGISIISSSRNRSLLYWATCGVVRESHTTWRSSWMA